MLIRPATARAALASVLLLIFASVAECRNLYRYTNADGVTVVDYRVPAEYVAGGYEILSGTGVVLEVVPRTLTDEEKNDLSAEQARQTKASAEEKRLREWDQSLLLRYSSVADIEAAKERALRELKIRLSILKGNKRSLKQQVENYQAQAADLERSGKRVDVARLSAIEDLQSEIESNDRSITDRAREIEEVSAAFQRDMGRFVLLLEVVELRNNMLVQQRESSETSAK